MSAGWARRLREFAPAIVVFVAVLLLLEFVATALDLQQFILPRPSAVIRAFGEETGRLQRSAIATLYEAIGGLVIGVTLGTKDDAGVGRSRRERDTHASSRVKPDSVEAHLLPDGSLIHPGQEY